jgi:hypothetical protein
MTQQDALYKIYIPHNTKIYYFISTVQCATGVSQYRSEPARNTEYVHARSDDLHLDTYHKAITDILFY